ncbi:DUF4256 domain-containing protein [Lagierella sp.]|uniref:DUF4256 domain-containing protein n=1 Tax=Lagierella sp. TaxID=2849657 RepID=UPI00260C7276|nr:DUF4256 domain-containing protein [Lagierella sp.]
MNNLKECLEKRFNENPGLVKGKEFKEIWEKIANDEKLLKVISKMEETEGEPLLIEVFGKIIAFDSYLKIPDSRKSLCYDRQAQEKRKANKPASDVMTEVGKIGSKLIYEKLYYEIQKVFKLDEKISSWVETPQEIRKLGGAIFCDRRFNRVFTYHNGADSYYSSRGFRTYVTII